MALLRSVHSQGTAPFARGLSVPASDITPQASDLTSQASAEASPTSPSTTAAKIPSEQPTSLSAAGAAPASSSEAATPVKADQAVPESTPPRNLKFELLRAGRERQYEKILELYSQMVKEELPIDMLCFPFILEAKGFVHGLAEAKETMALLLQMNNKLQPNAQIYAALLKSLEESGDKVSAFKLYEELLAHKIPPISEVFDSLVSIYCAAGDFPRAEEFFKEMRDKGVTPTRFTYYRYINGAFRQQEPERAFLKLVQAERDWRLPDLEAYRRMMAQFMKFAHLDGQMQCLKGMVDVDKTIDLNKYLLRMMEDATRKSDVDQVVSIHTMAEKAGVKLGTFQMVGLVFALLQTGREMEAFKLANQIVSQGGSLPRTAIRMVAESLGRKAALVDEAYFAVENLRKGGTEIPVISINIIIEACARLGDLDRAFATFAEMPNLSLKPDTQTYNHLLLTCVNAREVNSARRLLNLMQDESVALDADSYTHRCSVSVMTRDDEGAMTAYRECKDAKLVPPSKMYTTLVNMLVRQGRPDKAKEMLEEMGQYHKVMPFLQQKVDGATFHQGDRGRQTQRTPRRNAGRERHTD